MKNEENTLEVFKQIFLNAPSSEVKTNKLKLYSNYIYTQKTCQHNWCFRPWQFLWHLYCTGNFFFRAQSLWWVKKYILINFFPLFISLFITTTNKNQQWGKIQTNFIKDWIFNELLVIFNTILLKRQLSSIDKILLSFNWNWCEKRKI
jgi:hypothetical protein